MLAEINLKSCNLKVFNLSFINEVFAPTYGRVGVFETTEMKLNLINFCKHIFKSS